MRTMLSRVAGPLAALALAAALPATAQMVAHGMPGQPAVDHGGPGGPGDRDDDRDHFRGPMHDRGPMFGTMSDAGRRIITGAMYWMPGPRGGPPGRSRDGDRDRDQVHVSRDRILTLLSADRLDVVALRRAMDDERMAANQIKLRHQAAMLGAFQRLSPADRRAFVVDARSMRERMERPMPPRGDRTMPPVRR